MSGHYLEQFHWDRHLLPLFSEGGVARDELRDISPMLDNPPTQNRDSFATPDKKELYDIPLSIDIAASWPCLVRFDIPE